MFSVFDCVQSLEVDFVREPKILNIQKDFIYPGGCSCARDGSKDNIINRSG